MNLDKIVKIILNSYRLNYKVWFGYDEWNVEFMFPTSII